MGFFDSLPGKVGGFFDSLPDLDVKKKLKATVTTEETSARLADEEKVREGAGTLGLQSIIEGGLRAARGEQVPAELAAGVRAPRRVDVREQTNVLGEGSPENIIPDLFVGSESEATSKVGNAWNRFVEGARRSDDSLAEGHANLLGVGDIRELAPQRAVEDTRVVAPSDSAIESGLSIAGEVAPEAVASIATGGLTGASGAVAGALEGAGGNLARRVAARTATDVGLGAAENFLSAGRTPTPATTGVTAGFSLAFQSIPHVGRFANKVVAEGAFGDTAARWWKGAFRTGDSHAERIFQAVADELGDQGDDVALAAAARVPDAPTGAPRAAASDVAESEFDKIAREVSEEADSEFSKLVLSPAEGGPVERLTPFSRRTLAGGNTFQGLRELARTKGLELGVGEGTALSIKHPDGSVSTHANFTELRRAIDAAPEGGIKGAMAESIRSVAEDADDVVNRAVSNVEKLGLGSPAEKAEFAGAVASLPDDVSREKFIRGLADDFEPEEMMSGFDPVKVAREGLSFFERNSDKYQELYVNALLTNPGTHMVNLLSNTIQIPLRASTQTAETLAGVVPRTARWLGLELKPGGIADELAGRTFSDLGQAMKGYAQGVMHFDSVLAQAGNNIRLRRSVARFAEENDISDNEAYLLKSLFQAEDEGFLGAALDRWTAIKGVFTGDGGDDVVKALDAGLKEKFGARVDLGGLAPDVAQGVSQHAVPGKVGSLLRGPTQALQTSDSFFKDLFFHSEYNFAKQRLMAKHGVTDDILLRPRSALTDEEYAAKFEFLKDASETAQKQARFHTFTNELGPFGQAMVKVRDRMNLPFVPAGTLLAPFMNTPINIVKYTGRHSPIGLVKAGYHIVSQDMESSQVVQRMAEGSVGTLMMMGTWYLMNQGAIEVEGTINQGPEARTRELAAGGQMRNYTLKTSDGTRVPLNRFGPIGLIIGATADTYFRLEEILNERLEQGEKDAMRGAITEEELAVMREQAVNDAFFARAAATVSGQGPLKAASTGLEQGAGAVGSVLSNNLYNETALADAVRFLEQIGQATRRNDPNAFKGGIDFVEKKLATAIQPVAAVNSVAQALTPTAVNPDPDAGFLSNVATRVRERVPGMEAEGGIKQRDIFGQERRNRFSGDVGSPLSRVMGKLFSPFGGSTPELGVDPERDRRTAIAQEMERLSVFKDFPRVPDKVDEKFGRVPAAVVEQVQAFRGQVRFALVEEYLNRESYKKADDEKKAALLEKLFNKADSMSSEVVDGIFTRQARNKEPLDLSVVPQRYIDRWGLDIPALQEVEEQEGGLFNLTVRR